MRTMHTLPIIITVTMVAAAFTIPWIRLRCEQHRMAGLTMARATPPANASGIGSVIAAIIARTASGGNALEAFQEQFGARFATPRITAERIAVILRRHASDDDTEHDITRIAGHLASACALSERLGCEVHRCLQSVSDSYRRECKARDLRKEAFAAPQATIRLMSALPLATVALGEFMGAHPVTFLFGSPTGLACLVAGSVWYVLGLLWIRRLFARFNAGWHDGPPVPLALEMIGAAISQGSPIPMALAAVGQALEGNRTGGLATVLRNAGEALLNQTTWREAWTGACASAYQRQPHSPHRVRGRPACSATPEEIPVRSIDGIYAGKNANRHARKGTGKNDGDGNTGIGSSNSKGTGTGNDNSSTGNVNACHSDISRQAMLIANCLEAAWQHGASPMAQLRLAVAEHERAERSTIEQSAARLSIQLLSPTGLCFLPAFILIGIIPAIASFAA